MVITACGLQRLTVQTTVRSTPASPVHPTGVSNKGMLLPLLAHIWRLVRGAPGS